MKPHRQGEHCVVHLFFPGAEERLWITGIYFALSAWLVIRDWRRVKFLLREEPEEERQSRSGWGGRVDWLG